MKTAIQFIFGSVLMYTVLLFGVLDVQAQTVNEGLKVEYESEYSHFSDNPADTSLDRLRTKYMRYYNQRGDLDSITKKEYSLGSNILDRKPGDPYSKVYLTVHRKSVYTYNKKHQLIRAFTWHEKNLNAYMSHQGALTWLKEYSYPSPDSIVCKTFNDDVYNRTMDLDGNLPDRVKPVKNLGFKKLALSNTVWARMGSNQTPIWTKTVYHDPGDSTIDFISWNNDSTEKWFTRVSNGDSLVRYRIFFDSTGATLATYHYFKGRDGKIDTIRAEYRKDENGKIDTVVVHKNGKWESSDVLIRRDSFETRFDKLTPDGKLVFGQITKRDSSGNKIYSKRTDRIGSRRRGFNIIWIEYDSQGRKVKETEMNTAISRIVIKRFEYYD